MAKKPTLKKTATRSAAAHRSAAKSKVIPKKKQSAVRKNRLSKKRVGLFDTKIVVLAMVAVLLFGALFFFDRFRSTDSSTADASAVGHMSFVSDVSSVNTGQEFIVKVYADSKNVQVNAVQAAVVYPKDVVELKNVSNANSGYKIDAIQKLTEGRAEIVRGSIEKLQSKQLVSELTFVGLQKGTAAIEFDEADTILIRPDTNTNMLGSGSFKNLTLGVQ